MKAGFALTKKMVLKFAEGMLFIAFLINILNLILLFTTDLFDDVTPIAYAVLLGSVFLYFLGRYWCHDNPFIK